VPQGGLQGVRMQVFRPSTWAVFRCKLEVQLKVDCKHAKRYVLGLNLLWKIDKKIH